MTFKILWIINYLVFSIIIYYATTAMNLTLKCVCVFACKLYHLFQPSQELCSSSYRWKPSGYRSCLSFASKSGFLEVWFNWLYFCMEIDFRIYTLLTNIRLVFLIQNWTLRLCLWARYWWHKIIKIVKWFQFSLELMWKERKQHEEKEDSFCLSLKKISLVKSYPYSKLHYIPFYNGVLCVLCV